MKILLIAAIAASTIPLLAQAGERGVSRPDPTPITTTDEQAPAPAARKPSPYNSDANIVTTGTLPATAPTFYQDDASAYHPYHPAGTVPQSALNTRVVPPSPTADDDPDADIVTEVPLRPGEVGEGTVIKVRMDQPLSTVNTLRGQPFSATLTEDVLRDGVSVIHAGSVLDGTVTEVHGGRRIAGRAVIHLEPRRVTLADGRYYVVHAQVIETGNGHAVRVDTEGSIVRRDHPMEMLAVAGLTTGSGAVAGAVAGGGLGAIVGAGIGAGVSTVIWLKQDRQAALPKNTELVFSLTSPMMMQSLRDSAELRP